MSSFPPSVILSAWVTERMPRERQRIINVPTTDTLPHYHPLLPQKRPIHVPGPTLMWTRSEPSKVPPYGILRLQELPSGSKKPFLLLDPRPQRDWFPGLQLHIARDTSAGCDDP